MATNNVPEIVYEDKNEYVAIQNRDISNSNQNKASKLLGLLVAIGSMFAAYFIYLEIKNKRKPDTVA